MSVQRSILPGDLVVIDLRGSTRNGVNLWTTPGADVEGVVVATVAPDNVCLIIAWCRGDVLILTPQNQFGWALNPSGRIKRL
jgi:hypothetical protein